MAMLQREHEKGEVYAVDPHILPERLSSRAHSPRRTHSLGWQTRVNWRGKEGRAATGLLPDTGVRSTTVASERCPNGV